MRFLISSQTVSDRAKDATLGQRPAVAMLSHDTISGQRSRGLVSRLDAVPLLVTVQSPIVIDSEASTEVRFTIAVTRFFRTLTYFRIPRSQASVSGCATK